MTAARSAVRMSQKYQPWHIALATVLAMAIMSIGTISPARAAGPPSVANIEAFAESSTELSARQASTLAAVAELPEHSLSGLFVEADNPRAWRLDDGSVFVSVPLSGDGVYTSNVGALLDRRGSVLQRTEIAIQGDNLGGSVRMWIDGEETLNQYVASPDSSEVNIQAKFSWSKLNTCLSNAGIPAWAITAVSIACSAICVGTAGIGCLGCIAAAAGIAGGVAGYCLDQATK